MIALRAGPLKAPLRSNAAHSLGVSVFEGATMKCKECGHSVGFFNLKGGLCKKCLEATERKNIPILKTLPFKSNEAAFKYASLYLTRPIREKEVIFGIVVSEVQGHTNPDLPSTKKWKVKLATDQGIFQVPNCGSIAEGLHSKAGSPISKITSGDLVAVELSSYNPQFGIDHENQYYLIMVKLQPVLSVEKNVFLPVSQH